MNEPENSPKTGPRFPFFKVMAAFVFLIVFIGLFFPAGPHRGSGAKLKVAIAQIGAFKTALDLFKEENGHYPGTNGLTDLVVKPPDASGEWHQYLDQLPSDPWGLPYRYEYPGRHNLYSFDLSSAGPDGKFDTADDIGNWDELKR